MYTDFSSTPSLPIHLFVHGAGCDTHGDGSGFAWTMPARRREEVLLKTGLTVNVALYQGIADGLSEVPDDSAVLVFCSAAVVVNQMNGRFAIRDPKLRIEHGVVRKVIERKRLHVRCEWRKGQAGNPAKELFERERRLCAMETV